MLVLAQGVSAERCTDYLAPPGTSYEFHLADAILYHSFASRDNYVYACLTPLGSAPILCCFDLGHQIFDAPVYTGQLGLPTTPNRIVLRGDFAVLPMGSLGLGLVDLSTPDQPANLSLTATGDVCRDLALLGSDHVVTAEWSALKIYDLQDPASPEEIGAVTLTQARTVAAADGFAFVACGNLGLAIVDVSNPSVPFLVTQYPVGGFIDQVALEGNRVYLSGYLLGLVTLDVTTPASPLVVDILPLDGEAEAFVIQGGYAYITVGEAMEIFPGAPYFDAMALVRLNRFGTPTLVDYYFPAIDYSAIGLGDDRLFIGDGSASAGLIQARLQCPDLSDIPDSQPTNFTLSAPWPNPFNPRVSIRFSLPEGRPGQIRVHDLRGHLVTDIWSGVGDGLETTVTWNGTDSAGRACPSGTYGFTLTDRASGRTRRLTGTLLR